MSQYITDDGVVVDPRQAALLLQNRRESRKHFSHFMKQGFSVVEPGTKLRWNWHMDMICEYLQACYQRDINKLIINIPPRHMKSLLATVGWPAWMLGVDPTEQIITNSYSGKLSTKHSVDTRLLIESMWFQSLFPKTTIADGQNQKTEFVTTQRGYRVATSVGGTATGAGGNVLITDDPLNPKQAASDTEREAANTWLDQTWTSRRNDPISAVEVVVMQRLHQKDPTGHLLEQGGWEHLVIPMECEKTQQYSYGATVRDVKEGEILHEERFPAKEVKSLKTRLGSYGYASQYQQTPAPRGGGILKLEWFQRYGERPVRSYFTKITLSFDTAFKEAELNDPSVCLVFGTNTKGHYLLDIWKDKVRYSKLKRKALSLCDVWKPNEVLIEDKASGQSLIQDLQDETVYPIIPISTGTDSKVVRMDNEAPSVEAGNVFIAERAVWLYDFEQEVQHFPNSEYKDQCDALSQFLKRQRAGNEIYIG